MVSRFLKCSAKIGVLIELSKKIFIDLQPFDDLETMGVLVALLIKYTCLVQIVDAYFSRGVDDTLRVKHDAYMDDFSILVAKKRQVSGSNLRKEIDQLSFLNLLRGITGE